MKRKKTSFNQLSLLFSSPAERAAVGKVVGPVAARELVQPRDVGHRLAPEAQPSRRREDQPVARAPSGDEGGGLVAARRRHRAAVAVAGQVGRQRVAVGAVVGPGEAVDGAFHVVDEGGAVALADLHGEADAVGGGALRGGGKISREEKRFLSFEKVRERES